MRRIIYILILGLSVGLMATSCTQKFEPIFKESASQRIEVAMKSYDKTLKSSEEGWLLQYFPHDEQKYGGYNFFVKFTEPNSVEVKTELYKEGAEAKTSMYGIIQNGGPVLTFNTYNDLMHFFATPSADEYLGKQGDFEFLIVSSENDEVTLRGMKTGNMMKLTKISKSPEEYIADTKKVSNFLDGATVRSKFGDVFVETSLDVANRQLTFEYTNKEGEETFTKVAYVYTDTGIHLYKSIEINEIEVIDFTLNKEDKKLVSSDGKVEIEMVFAPVNFSSLTWSIKILGDDVSKTFKEVWQQAYDADAAKWGEELWPIVSLGLTPGNTVGVSMYSKARNKQFPYRVTYLLGFKGSFENENHMSVEGLGGGFNWKWYSHFMPLADLIIDNSPYEIEVITEDQVKMTSANNSDVWFIMNKL